MATPLCSLCRNGGWWRRRKTIQWCVRYPLAVWLVYLLMPGLAGAQALTTYWLIPPSSGCDGSWAFGPASVVADACPLSSWTFSPGGCVDFPSGIPPFPNVSGDTILVDVCSLPCAFQVSVDTGICMICIAPPFTLTEANGSPRPWMRITPNPVGLSRQEIILDGTSLTHGTMLITDGIGRILYTKALDRLPTRVILPVLTPGIYLVEIIADNAHLTQILLKE